MLSPYLFEDGDMAILNVLSSVATTVTDLLHYTNVGDTREVLGICQSRCPLDNYNEIICQCSTGMGV